MRRLAACLLCIAMISFPAKAAESEKLVALTFDDGPSGRFTRRLLAELKQRDVKATFFLCGYRIVQYPKLTEQIWQEGHEIGIHGYSHDSMKAMCARQVAAEVEKTQQLLPADCQPLFLRPPGGLCSDCVQTVAENFGLSVLQWSLDPKDWAVRDAKQVAEYVLSRAQDGDVILLHDMSDSSIDAALLIIDGLLARGFRFVTATELAKANQHTTIPGKVYTAFRRTDQAK